ncbi:MAG: FxsA family protein [Bacillota bacterium]|jgi:UPF0716 protein FxsA
MLGYFLALLTVITILEIYIIVLVGKNIGIVNVLLIFLISGLAGLLLIKQQGWQAIRSIGHTITHGQLPNNDHIERLLILVGSFLLLTPGLISDTVGLSLLFPWTRNLWNKYLLKKIKSWLKLKWSKLLYR